MNVTRRPFLAGMMLAAIGASSPALASDPDGAPPASDQGEVAPTGAVSSPSDPGDTLADLAEEAEAGASDAERIQIHSSGVWAFGITDHNRYLSASPEGSYDYLTFNFQALAQIVTPLKIYFQVFAGSEDAAGASETPITLDYAYADWAFSDALHLQVGQPKQPFGIYALIWDIGTLRPFTRLNQTVYGDSGVTAESYRGAGLTGRLGGPGAWGSATTSTAAS